MSSLEVNIDSESWDDLWGDMVAGLAPSLDKMNCIEAFRIETERCKTWIRKNSSSLSSLEAWRVAELIRITFSFNGGLKLRQSVIQMALKELGLLPLDPHELEVCTIRNRVFDKTLN